MEQEKKTIRYREIQKKIRLTEEENKKILERMEETGINKFNTFARKMILNGSIYNVDVFVIKEHTLALKRIGNNINQIALILNANNNFSDVIELKAMMNQLIEGENEIIKACRNINKMR